ncbi:hypothetical protein Nepgr_009215 [Nepenthes gracilis]|uniref:Uncharacterized protein n=1 Tax=Nepenthes gracilis TaxID=150966 RepID=A0AAD3SAF1_NEPGR|nr:hypothetical protein Nepgr_009215 [Nepenthes gracilis]
MVAIAHKVDIDYNEELELPLNAIKVGVEHLGMPARNNQALLDSFYHGEAVDHHGGDQGPCSSLGLLMRNIEELRKQHGASRARILEVSYHPRQSFLDGSGSVQSCFELPGVPVISECLLQCKNPDSALLSEEHLADDVRIFDSRGVRTITPSPIPADGMSPSSEGGGPPSFPKKPRRHKKKRFPFSIPHVQTEIIPIELKWLCCSCFGWYEFLGCTTLPFRANGAGDRGSYLPAAFFEFC